MGVLHNPTPSPAVLSTGIRGLDAILQGGLPSDRVYLLEGSPGTGKTTLALQFLMTGVALGERCLYVTLSESATELEAVAQSHGWHLQGIDIFELVTAGRPEEEYTIFRPAEVEFTDTVNAVIEYVERINPSRVVIDSLAEFRLLATEPIRYRRQILALKQFFLGRRATVLLLDDNSGRIDLQVHSISHGVIRLEQRIEDYGQERRRVVISKLRGVKFKGGFHDLRIDTGGIRIFPRVVASDHAVYPAIAPVPSGIAELDGLLGGGLSTGTSTAILGPAGSGKTVLATQFASTIAQKGGRAAIYLFDERLNTFLHRTRGLGLDVPRLVDEGRISVAQLDPDQVTPGELADAVRAQVEQNGVRVLLIDSLNGYLSAMRDEAAVLAQLHELLSYLNHRGVLTLITVAQSGVFGAGIQAPIDVSYLADTVIILRFFEADGAVHKAISVVKKRTGEHETTIRELQITPDCVKVGEPLTAFRGVLMGVPQYVGDSRPLFEMRGDDDPA